MSFVNFYNIIETLQLFFPDVLYFIRLSKKERFWERFIRMKWNGLQTWIGSKKRPFFWSEG